MANFLLALLVSASSFVDLEKLGIGAYAAHDYATYLQAMTESARLAPNVPRVIYNLASAQALNGKKTEAFATLQTLADLTVYMAIDKDDDFKSLRGTPEWDRALKAIEANRAPRGRADVVATLKERDLITEGVAYDAATKTTYVAVVKKRKVIAIGADGKQRDFVRSGQDDLGGVSALALDGKRKWLWVTSNRLSVVEGYKAEDKDVAGVFAFDLATGKLMKKAMLARDGKAHMLGELVLLPDGALLASDSYAPCLFRTDGDKIEEWLRGPFRSLQGIAVLPDGVTIVVADYAQGLFKIGLRDKQVTPLLPGPRVVTTGVDGVYVYRDKLLVTQNGLEPQRVVELTYDPAAATISAQRILLAGDPRYDDLALGCVAGDTLLVNAKTGWAMWGEDGKPKGALPAPPHVLLSVPLTGGSTKSGQP